MEELHLGFLQPTRKKLKGKEKDNVIGRTQSSHSLNMDNLIWNPYANHKATASPIKQVKVLFFTLGGMSVQSLTQSPPPPPPPPLSIQALVFFQVCFEQFTTIPFLWLERCPQRQKWTSCPRIQDNHPST